jgi:uncharacterized protein YdhG (YjbR/CyaY superfamily)
MARAYRRGFGRRPTEVDAVASSRTFPGHAQRMDDAVRDYLAAILPDQRPLFDRMHRLVLDAHPGAEVVLSYKMPTYVVGDRRLYVGVWKHGLSLYGWEYGRDAGFTARHPHLDSGKGTIRLPYREAGSIPDAELRELARAALDA